MDLGNGQLEGIRGEYESWGQRSVSMMAAFFAGSANLS